MSQIAVLALLLAGEALAQGAAWSQCGGQGWSGATTCVSGYTCVRQNDYYSQCIPGTASTSAAATTTRSTTTSVVQTTTSRPASTTLTISTTSATTSRPVSTTLSTTTRVSTTTSASATPSGGSGSGAWSSAYTKAKTALAKLSNADKIKIVTGVGWSKGPCVGNTGAVSSIGYPSLCLQDGPLGVRYVQGVTAFPAGVQAASTWDTALIYSRGNALGAEAKGVGVHVQLGPVAGPLGKNAQGGRNWEGFAAGKSRLVH